MKKIITIVPLVLMVIGCGPSLEDKIRIAESTCAVILETRKFESSKRIELLNKAREQVGDYDGPYPMSDDFLWSSYSLGGKQACINDIVKPPPPTMAEIEAERERQKALEEIRKKREEEERIAAEEAIRKAAEKEQWIIDNTIKTHLYCETEAKKRIWEEQENGQYGYTEIGPMYIALIEVNKIDSEDQSKLKEYGFNFDTWSYRYINSPLYYDIAMDVSEYGCYSAAFAQSAGGKEFCIGKYKETSESLEGRLVDRIFDNKFYSSADENPNHFGNKVLYWGYNDFVLDTVNLKAGDPYNLTRSDDDVYQCEITSKEAFNQKLEEVKERVQSKVDAVNNELEKKKAESVPQI